MATPNKGTIGRKIRQPSTYAGLLTIGAAVLTGGTSVLTDPLLLSQLGAGLALVLTEEPQ